MSINISPAEIERVKLLHGYLKHMATLSTGALLLIVAFLEKVFPNPSWRALVAVSIPAFLLSIVSNLITQTVSFAQLVPGENPLENAFKTTFGIAMIGTWGGFLLGIIAFAVFALKNIF